MYFPRYLTCAVLILLKTPAKLKLNPCTWMIQSIKVIVQGLFELTVGVNKLALSLNGHVELTPYTFFFYETGDAILDVHVK